MGLVRFGLAELWIMSVARLLICSGPTLHRLLGLRILTFHRTSDVAFGLFIVTAFLGMILLFGPN